MKFVLNELHRNVSDEELLADIKRTANYLGKDILTMTDYGKHGKYHGSTIQKHFGGWANACTLCGLGKQRRISDEEMLEDMRSTAKKLEKHTLTVREYSNIGKYKWYDIERRFNGWNKALKQAGLGVTLQKGFSTKDLIEEIERIWILLGRQPTTTDIKSGVSRYGLTTYIRYFGSWRKALETFVTYVNDENAINDELVMDIENDVTDIKVNDFRHKTKREINLRLRFLVMQRDNFKCCYCGASPAKDPSVELHIDHINPWSKGGETVYENLQTLCSKCNLGKSNLME